MSKQTCAKQVQVFSTYGLGTFGRSQKPTQSQVDRPVRDADAQNAAETLRPACPSFHHTNLHSHYILRNAAGDMKQKAWAGTVRTLIKTIQKGIRRLAKVQGRGEPWTTISTRRFFLDGNLEEPGTWQPGDAVLRAVRCQNGWSYVLLLDGLRRHQAGAPRPVCCQKGI